MPGPKGKGLNGHANRCRCSAECIAHTRQVVAEDRARARRRAKANGVVTVRGYAVLTGDINHGTRTSYQLGCRCQQCRTAQSEYRRRLRLGEVEPDPAPVINLADYRSPEPEPTLIFQRADWMKHGSCVGHDTAMWFPEKWDNGRARQAKRICATCPVRVQCLQYALDNHERHGIWGGASVKDRQRIRRQLEVAS